MATTSSSLRLESFTDNTDNRLQVIEDDIMVFIQISLTIIVRGGVSLLGVITNLVNIAIFFKLGLKDSMSVGLFALSLADFLLTFLQLANCMCYLGDIVYPTNPVDLWSVGYFIFGWAINATYRVSFWITVMVSIERCLCVVSPFKVKQTFTRFRCVIIILTICIVHIAITIPVYVSQRMEWSRWPHMPEDQNSTTIFIAIFTIRFNGDADYLEIVLDIAIGVVWLVLSQAIVIVCAVWMGYALKASTSVRHNASTRAQEGGSRKPLASNLTDRERRLLKVVLLLAIILTVCNIPRYLTLTVYYSVQDMNIGQEANLSNILWTLTAISSTLGSSMNFFVYLTVNSKFRRVVGQFTATYDTDKRDKNSDSG